MAGDGVTKKQPSCSASCCVFCGVLVEDVEGKKIAT